MCTDTINFYEIAEITPEDFPNEFNIDELIADLDEYDLTEQEKYQALHVIRCMLESVIRTYLGLDPVTDAIDLRQFQNAISGSSVVNSDQKPNRQFKQAACAKHATREESDE